MRTIPERFPHGARITSGVALAAVALALAAGGARSAAPQHERQHVVMSEAEKLFPDAPDGVDPMTTGPVSAGFKARQAQAGCAKAIWPNIPAACYPR